MAGLGCDAQSECVLWVAGGETEEEKILVDILENQLMDSRMEMVRLCFDPNFVSPAPHSQSPLSLASGPEQRRTHKVRPVADPGLLIGNVYSLVLQNIHMNHLLF